MFYLHCFPAGSLKVTIDTFNSYSDVQTFQYFKTRNFKFFLHTTIFFTFEIENPVGLANYQ